MFVRWRCLVKQVWTIFINHGTSLLKQIWTPPDVILKSWRRYKNQYNLWNAQLAYLLRSGIYPHCPELVHRTFDEECLLARLRPQLGQTRSQYKISFFGVWFDWIECNKMHSFPTDFIAVQSSKSISGNWKSFNVETSTREAKQGGSKWVPKCIYRKTHHWVEFRVAWDYLIWR